jgi:glycosyltransferase involved in cell wall biosynthesis
MKIIQVPFSFAPDPVGGTEVYVTNLARDLGELGVDAIVAAPGETNSAYTWEGLRVRRFAGVKEIIDVSQLYGPGDPVAATEFAKIIDEERPDLLHLHAFTSTVSLHLIRLAKRRNIPVVFTYHTPTVSCQRGTLMLWGKEICDGRLEARRCAACNLHGRGLYRPLAKSIARLPYGVTRRLTAHGSQGGMWTALRMRELVNMRHDVFRAMVSEVDHIVAVCNWIHELLLFNNVPASKLSISRHGVRVTENQKIAVVPAVMDKPSDEMQVVFLGRSDPTKGLHVIVEALANNPELNVKLDIYGIVQNAANLAYQDKIMKLSKADPRISFHRPIAPGEVVSKLRKYDFLVVPSQWIETGPMVALEAFAAGVPVIGWNIGGIAEIVRDKIDGFLIEPGSDWGVVLSRLVQDVRLRARLKAGVRPPRTSIEVAHEMVALYEPLLGSARARFSKQSSLTSEKI